MPGHRMVPPRREPAADSPASGEPPEEALGLPLAKGWRRMHQDPSSSSDDDPAASGDETARDDHDGSGAPTGAQ